MILSVRVRTWLASALCWRYLFRDVLFWMYLCYNIFGCSRRCLAWRDLQDTRVSDHVYISLVHVFMKWVYNANNVFNLIKPVREISAFWLAFSVPRWRAQRVRCLCAFIFACLLSTLGGNLQHRFHGSTQKHKAFLAKTIKKQNPQQDSAKHPQLFAL